MPCFLTHFKISACSYKCPYGVEAGSLITIYVMGQVNTSMSPSSSFIIVSIYLEGLASYISNGGLEVVSPLSVTFLKILYTPYAAIPTTASAPTAIADPAPELDFCFF